MLKITERFFACWLVESYGQGKYRLWISPNDAQFFNDWTRVEAKLYTVRCAKSVCSENRELSIRGQPRLRDLTWSFCVHSQNIDFPESFIVPFFTRKVNIVIFSEGGYAPSRSQNDQTSNIRCLVFATMTFSLRLVVEWRGLPHFPAKMTLVHAEAQLSTLTRSRTRL